MTTPSPESVPVWSEIVVRPVAQDERSRYQAQMAAHHYLGALSAIGETLWYAATWRGRWLAQIGLSAAALKCGVRERWIGSRVLARRVGADWRQRFGHEPLLETFADRPE